MASNKSADKFMETLQDPDMVGASEYRAVHELLKDVTDGFDGTEVDNNLRHLDCVLSELIGHARTIQAKLRKYRKGA